MPLKALFIDHPKPLIKGQDALQLFKRVHQITQSKSQEIKSNRSLRPLAEPLEPRLLFSASADIALFEEADNDIYQLQDAAEKLDLTAVYAEEASVLDTNVRSTDVSEVVFVDTNVENYQDLIDDIIGNSGNENIEIVLLDQNLDGIEQITDTLMNYSGLSAIHILSHGDDSSLKLGSGELSNDNIDEYDTDITSWQAALSESADILIYGCNLASADEGLNLIDQLAQLSSADVAASDDLTGNAQHGGDWELEHSTGSIEAALILGQSQQWQGVLATTTYIDSGTVTDQTIVSNVQAAGQTFLYDSGNGEYGVDELTVQLKKLPSTATQTITIELRTAWTGGEILGTATLSSDDLVDNTFTPQTLTFTDGVVLSDNVSYYIRITSDGSDGTVTAGYDSSATFADGQYVNDSGSLDASRDLAFKVAYSDAGNSAPYIDNPIADQAIFSDNTYSFTFAADTFKDVDADSLTYSAEVGGGALPGWLSFDSATRTFSGTPSSGDTGFITIEVISDDGNGHTVSDFFNLNVQANAAPTGAVTITGTAAEDQVLTASNTLADSDGMGAVTYQWQRDGVDISGATSDTYTLLQADVGATITVVASYLSLIHI